MLSAYGMTIVEGVGGYDIQGTVYDKNGSVKQAKDLQSLTCSMCQFILRDPKQVIACGHRFCKTCIEQLTAKGYL